jgi:prepilin-type N-terminal cleavage/methylation domain-containing protein
MSLVRALRHRLAAEGGYSLVELLTVLVILGTVLGALTGLFVSASRAELDMNERFQAQQNARLALTKMRRDVHCANAAMVTATTNPIGSRVSLTMPAVAVGGCGTAQVSWCTVQLASSRFGLFRATGSTCGTGAVKFAEHLTIGNAFVAAPRSPDSLATLAVDFRVDVKAPDSRAAYRLQDTLALRRSGRGV